MDGDFGKLKGISVKRGLSVTLGTGFPLVVVVRGPK